MKLSLISQKGFTLIELMVVVAIIGILSAIAVPNFKKYQAKSKQSEAKIQLAAVYSVEVGAMADYDSYATCLDDLGYDASPRGYYLIGFGAAEVGNVTTRFSACTTSPFNWAPTTHLKSGTTVPATAQLPTTAIIPAGTSFTAGAAGNISSTLYDTWTITHTKALTNANLGY